MKQFLWKFSFAFSKLTVKVIFYLLQKTSEPCTRAQQETGKASYSKILKKNKINF